MKKTPNERSPFPTIACLLRFVYNFKKLLISIIGHLSMARVLVGKEKKKKKKTKHSNLCTQNSYFHIAVFKLAIRNRT